MLIVKCIILCSLQMMFKLCTRPLTGKRFLIAGRETELEPSSSGLKKLCVLAATASPSSHERQLFSCPPKMCYCQNLCPLKRQIHSSPFSCGTFKKNIQMDFLAHIVSVERSGPHTNHAGCHSASHFVQFHVLSP